MWGFGGLCPPTQKKCGSKETSILSSSPLETHSSLGERNSKSSGSEEPDNESGEVPHMRGDLGGSLQSEDW